jgi:hypothetical protein
MGLAGWPSCPVSEWGPTHRASYPYGLRRDTWGHRARQIPEGNYERPISSPDPRTAKRWDHPPRQASTLGTEIPTATAPGAYMRPNNPHPAPGDRMEPENPQGHRAWAKRTGPDPPEHPAPGAPMGPGPQRHPECQASAWGPRTPRPTAPATPHGIPNDPDPPPQPIAGTPPGRLPNPEMGTRSSTAPAPPRSPRRRPGRALGRRQSTSGGSSSNCS